MDGILEGLSLYVGKSEAEGEREDESCHHAHDRRDVHGEERGQFGGSVNGLESGSVLDHSREESSASEV